MVVGGLGARGVVAAASYEARRFGIHSAMPTARARRLCPDAAFVAPRLDLYADVSREVMAILRSATPLVEPLSLDEAFLDVRGCGPPARLRPGDRRGAPAPHPGRARPHRLGRRGDHQDAGEDRERRLQARRPARDRARHRARVPAPAAGPPPVGRRPGDPAQARRPRRRARSGDLAGIPEHVLVDKLGEAAGRHLHALAAEPRRRGRWSRDRVAKSIGHEETFATDRSDRRGLEQDVVRMADRVASRLREHGKVGAHRAAEAALPRLRDDHPCPHAAGGDRPRGHDRRRGAGARSTRSTSATGSGCSVSPRSNSRTRSRSRASCRSVPVRGRRAATTRSSGPSTRCGRASAPTRSGRAAYAVDGRVRADRRGSLWGPDDESTEPSAARRRDRRQEGSDVLRIALDRLRPHRDGALVRARPALPRRARRRGDHRDLRS